MVERFVETAGTISIDTGDQVVLGTGTIFGGIDREAAQIWCCPVDAAPFYVGTVAAVDPVGVYDDLELPLVHAYNGDPIVGQPFELIDGLALAKGATQAAIYSRFAQFLATNRGLTGNLADDIDFNLNPPPNNSMFVDSVTRKIYQWRNGVLNEVFAVGLAFNPRGEFDIATEYDLNDLVEYDGSVFISNADSNLGNTPVTTPVPVSDANWTLFPLPRQGEFFEVAPFIQGRPGPSEPLWRYVFSTATNFLASSNSSQADARVDPAADFEIDIQKNGVSVGDITFPAGDTVGVITWDADTAFTPGDVIGLVAPSGQDADIQDISITLRGLRDGASETASVPLAGGVQMTGALEPKAYVDLASANTLNIGAQTSNYLRITGTTQINELGTAAAGTVRYLRFASALVFQHGSAIILPGAANITTATNDTCKMISLGSNSWICEFFKRASGKPIAVTSADLTDGSAAGRLLFAGPRGADLFKMLIADDTGANSSSAQPWFPTAGAVTVAAATTYYFEGLLWLTRAAGSTSHTTGLLFGGTATLTSIDYFGEANTGDTNALAASNGFMASAATELVVKAASTSTTENILVRVVGLIRINAGGTLIPQFKYSAAPGGAPTVKRNSHFRLVPLGTNTVATSGTWS